MHGVLIKTNPPNSVLQISKAFGATQIIAVDVQDAKLDTAKTFGATHAINSRKEDAVAKIKVFIFHTHHDHQYI